MTRVDHIHLHFGLSISKMCPWNPELEALDVSIDGLFTAV